MAFKPDIENGKYTIVVPENDGMHALRHGEPWRSLTGDKMVLSMAQEIQALREREKLLAAALDVAMGHHAPDMPGDSRAVPDWMVACAAVQANLNDDDGRIADCLTEEQSRFPLPAREPAPGIEVSAGMEP
jgi:hypothetical protein